MSVEVRKEEVGGIGKIGVGSRREGRIDGELEGGRWECGR